MLKKMLELSQGLTDLGIMSCFVGPFTQEFIAEMGSTLRDAMKENNESSSRVVKVFSVVVELSQNILHYSRELMGGGGEETPLRMGMLAVGKKGDQYFVLSGNLIASEQREELVTYIDRLNGMDKQELRKLYSQKRREGPGPDSKGAGLGFIEMSRKASGPIECSWHEVDGAHCFFSLKIQV